MSGGRQRRDQPQNRVDGSDGRPAAIFGKLLRGPSGLLEKQASLIHFGLRDDAPVYHADSVLLGGELGSGGYAANDGDGVNERSGESQERADENHFHPN